MIEIKETQLYIERFLPIQIYFQISEVLKEMNIQELSVINDDSQKKSDQTEAIKIKMKANCIIDPNFHQRLMLFEKKKLKESFNVLTMFRGIPPNIQEN